MAIAQHSLGAAAVAIVALRIIEVGCWTLADIWRTNTAWLLGLDCLGSCAGMSLGAYFSLDHRVSFMLAVLCALPFVLFWFTREPFQSRLRARLKDAKRHGKAPKPHLDWIEVLLPSERDPTLMIVVDLTPRASQALGGLRRLPSARPSALALFTVICVLALSGLMLAVAAAEHVMSALQGPTSKAQGTGGSRTTSPSTTTSTTPTITAPAPTTSTSRSRSASVPTGNQSHSEKEGDSWNGQCNSTPSNSTLLQHEVEIEELYVGNALSREGSDPRFRVPVSTGEPPGRKEGGCTLEYHSNEALGFVWAWGEIPSTHRHLSIAVDSPTGPALFIEPAAQEVHALIEKYGEVSGIRRFNAGRGDFYPVDTIVGTYILIRREKGTYANAGAFEVIPPYIAEIWVTTVDGKHRFLWPRLTQHEGQAMYDFDTNTPTTTVAYTVPYPSSTASEPQIGEAELQQAADYAG